METNSELGYSVNWLIDRFVFFEPLMYVAGVSHIMEGPKLQIFLWRKVVGFDVVGKETAFLEKIWHLK
jgi:hypothetical protein